MFNLIVNSLVFTKTLPGLETELNQLCDPLSALRMIFESLFQQSKSEQGKSPAYLEKIVSFAPNLGTKTFLVLQRFLDSSGSCTLLINYVYLRLDVTRHVSWKI